MKRFQGSLERKWGKRSMNKRKPRMCVISGEGPLKGASTCSHRDTPVYSFNLKQGSRAFHILAPVSHLSRAIEGGGGLHFGSECWARGTSHPEECSEGELQVPCVLEIRKGEGAQKCWKEIQRDLGGEPTTSTMVCYLYNKIHIFIKRKKGRVRTSTLLVKQSDLWMFPSSAQVPTPTRQPPTPAPSHTPTCPLKKTKIEWHLTAIKAFLSHVGAAGEFMSMEKTRLKKTSPPFSFL